MLKVLTRSQLLSPWWSSVSLKPACFLILSLLVRNGMHTLELDFNIFLPDQCAPVLVPGTVPVD